MKKIIYLLPLLFLFSCEKVIDAKLTTEAPKLVIDASIQWEKGTDGKVQTIKLSTTGAYYLNETPKVSGASISVKNTANTVFNFIEVPNTGNYVCNNFEPVIGETYTLTVLQNGQTYKAQEKLVSVPNILNVEQRNDLGFGSNEIGIKTNFQDNGLEDNFYLMRYQSIANAYPEFEVIDDIYRQGIIISSLYSNKKLKTGMQMNIKFFGVSELYNSYMNKLIGATGANSFGPFSTPQSSVNGNIVNQANSKNNALGFFNLSQFCKLQYTIR
jgi:hypothetical protein